MTGTPHSKLLPFRRADLAPPGARYRVGLLGGSFNPAHDGHLYLSRQAIKRLRLDAVWWLVSPQNPLKPRTGMAPTAERLTRARAVAAADRRIRVTDLEARAGLRYTVETVAWLRTAYPRLRFVWLMGADNLVQVDRWRRWSHIFHMVPIAVCARDSYAYPALVGKAATRFRRARLPDRSAVRLAECRPPAWVYLAIRRHPASATAIRAQRAADSPAPGLQDVRRRNAPSQRL